jgi:hypothetical protein
MSERFDRTATLDDRAEIEGILASINAAWQTLSGGDVARCIGQHLAPGAVLVASDLTRVARGRDAFAQSYEDFASRAKILDVNLDAPLIDIIGVSAVATLTWRMRYDIGGTLSTEAGHDTYVFARQDKKWLVIWRNIESVHAE